MIATGRKENRNPLNARIIQDRFSHYKAATAEEYRAKLKKMSMWDLSEEAVRAGIAPGSERDRIERTLLDDYRKAKQSYEIAAGMYQKPDIKTKEPSEQVKEMLDFIRH